MATNKTILVTGVNGQLGKEFQALALHFSQYKFLFTSRYELAIENAEQVQKYFADNTIDFCINCAAYTAVDKAEIEIEAAFLTNATAVGNLAAICKQYQTQLIHISTDYVFDGTGISPYKETDAVNPVSVYGLSKLKGEELILQNNPAAIIIRTSWVFSAHGNNFVKTMLRLMKEKDTLNVVNDQFGCPTYAADLAAAIMQIINASPSVIHNTSIFNYCNQGVTSWYNFALTIKEFTGSNCLINPIPTMQYPTPAKRPQYSVLDTASIQSTFGINIPHWHAGLKHCLSQLA
jgi:dTDP-4-dehydrorhamnose reductase